MKVVILAGGKGTRLKPYTTVFPKPLMPINDKPILEIVIRQLKSYGFGEVIITVGHLAELIMTFFGDGSKFGIKIKYSREDKPLGTAGPLALMKDELNEAFLMMNGDVLSTLDYFDLVNYHKRNGAIATIALKKRDVKIDFGVVELDEENSIVGYTEKPKIDYLVSMGVYVFEPRVLEYIKPNKYLDFPDLIKELISNGETVKGYIYDGYWLDIGRPDDYERANREIEEVYPKLFKRCDNMEWKIPLSDIDLGEEEIEAVTKVLKSKWLSMGPVTQRFEEQFADYLGVKYAFGVSSGTAALHIALKALGIKEGDEVIVPSLTFVATANSILYCGAKPVFADINSLNDFDISPDDISEKITNKTKAITIVHYGGYPCDMDAIMEIAEDHNLKVIEDAAHAPGAEYKGKKCGTIGDIGCFSFFANKNLVTGEGGMVVTNDDALAEKIRIMRSHGMTTLTWDRHEGHAHSYDVVDIGFNYRINEVASALGLVQLKKLSENNGRRKKIVEGYRKRLEDISGIFVPFKNHKEKPSYHIFPILLSEDISRNALIDRLKEKGIQTSIHYPPIHLFTCYRKVFGFKEGMLSKTEFVGEHEVTLPLHPLMNEEYVEYIVNYIGEY